MKNPLRELSQKAVRTAVRLSRPADGSLRKEFKQVRREEHAAVFAALAAKTGSSCPSGKVAIVTGAGIGIGRATAVLFFQQGAKVVVADAERGVVFSEKADWSQLGTYGLPEDVACAALFLASAESSFVTGPSLVADGGLTRRGD